jgi:hypothetical protein
LIFLLWPLVRVLGYYSTDAVLFSKGKEVELQNSDGEKDIHVHVGVLVDDQLNYSQHIQQKINKANSIIALHVLQWYIQLVHFSQLC